MTLGLLSLFRLTSVDRVCSGTGRTGGNEARTTEEETGSGVDGVSDDAVGGSDIGGGDPLVLSSDCLDGFAALDDVVVAGSSGCPC
jgi:hypothetical protein